eukprot:6941949-Alexandrium_andersonii.AAC.1
MRTGQPRLQQLPSTHTPQQSRQQQRQQQQQIRQRPRSIARCGRGARPADGLAKVEGAVVEARTGNRGNGRFACVLFRITDVGPTAHASSTAPSPLFSSSPSQHQACMHAS